MPSCFPPNHDPTLGTRALSAPGDSWKRVIRICPQRNPSCYRKRVALKIIDLDADDGDDVDSIQREVALLTQLRDGPNITKYYGCHLDGPRVWIVMEFAQGGSVYKLMQSSPDSCIEEKYVAVIVREVLIGLSYLHKSNVIHRDIKAANVLVTASGKVMICDFGVSALLATTSSKRNTFIGTPYWMAPEVAQPVPAYDTKADIWSLGIMIYEMMKGSPPHFRVAHMKVIQMIPKVKPPRLADSEGSKDLRDFIPFTLTESPSDRLTAEDLLKTKWIKSASKSPITILKDLLIRYETWVKAGSKPSDLSEPLPWEKESDPGRPETDENPWEFDTVRGRSSSASGLGPAQITLSEGQASTTIKPQSSKLPTSLRHLFDNDVTSAPDPFRIQGFSAAGKDTAPGITGSPALPSSPATPLPVARDRAARRALRIENSLEDGPNLSTATFAFPPRRATKAKVGTGISPSDDQINSGSPYLGHADKPSVIPGSSPSEAAVTGSNTPIPTSIPPKFLARRDLRLDSVIQISRLSPKVQAMRRIS
ncbi:kinase-like domain-containing protein [Russula brevipes]|nr:kinase-like domain-containing protein [Russula brevipes]